jgi:hypothetical protein
VREAIGRVQAELKGTLDGSLRKTLSKGEFAAYSTAELDVFGVRIGDLRRYDR